MSALIDVDQLRTLIAIVETGSFTKAADVVHKTQSAVSMQMKRLEERLERPIFARDGRASKLTEDGQRLLDYARRIVKLNVETLAAFSDDELSGRVRLGVPDDYADRYLPEIMARFSRVYPGVGEDKDAMFKEGNEDENAAPAPDGIPVFNTAKASHFNSPAQGFFHFQVTENQLVAREFATKDGWKTGAWTPQVWQSNP
jgi:molybdenum-dependent DNA-binding transcriptional regulator ModE